MVIYKCEKCSKEYYNKTDYSRHINRKFSCANTETKEKVTTNDKPVKHNQLIDLTVNINQYNNYSDVNVNDAVNHITKIIKCDKCNKTFTRSDNLKKHKRKYCYKIIDDINEIKELHQNNNNSNDNIDDIKIIAFGKENLSEILTDEDAIKYISMGHQSIYKLIEDIHFDPNKQKFHNVLISDKTRKDAIIFNGEDWNITEKTYTIDKLFNDKLSYLTIMFKKIKHKLDKKMIREYSKFINCNDQETIECIKNDIRRLLYNKRHIPINTRKIMNK